MMVVVVVFRRRRPLGTGSDRPDRCRRRRLCTAIVAATSSGQPATAATAWARPQPTGIPRYSPASPRCRCTPPASPGNCRSRPARSPAPRTASAGWRPGSGKRPSRTALAGPDTSYRKTKRPRLVFWWPCAFRSLIWVAVLEFNFGVRGGEVVTLVYVRCRFWAKKKQKGAEAAKRPFHLFTQSRTFLAVSAISPWLSPCPAP